MARPATPSLLAANGPGWLGLWLGRLLARAYRLTGRDRYDDFRIERVSGFPVLVLPTVANPAALRTGAFFAEVLQGPVLEPGSAVLDLGTGSGICALVSASRSARVIATDINPAAARCTHINAMINGLEDQIDVRHGDLFQPVSEETFDIVLFNPPFLLGEPRDDRATAWYSDSLPLRFAQGLAKSLRPGGFGLVLLSTFGDACPVFEAELVQRGFALEVFAQRRLINETISILRATPPSIQKTTA